MTGYGERLMTTSATRAPQEPPTLEHHNTRRVRIRVHTWNRLYQSLKSTFLEPRGYTQETSMEGPEGRATESGDWQVCPMLGLRIVSLTSFLWKWGGILGSWSLPIRGYLDHEDVKQEPAVRLPPPAPRGSNLQGAILGAYSAPWGFWVTHTPFAHLIFVQYSFPLPRISQLTPI
jgi:hypothetical protein